MGRSSFVVSQWLLEKESSYDPTKLFHRCMKKKPWMMDMEASFPLVHPIESFVSSFALLKRNLPCHLKQFKPSFIRVYCIWLKQCCHDAVKGSLHALLKSSRCRGGGRGWARPQRCLPLRKVVTAYAEGDVWSERWTLGFVTTWANGTKRAVDGGAPSTLALGIGTAAGDGGCQLACCTAASLLHFPVRAGLVQLTVPAGQLAHTKNDAFQAFKKFKVLTENKTGYKIRTLRTDRGGEFLSTEFTRFCGNEGIERHLTAPYTPQQNGVVERRNRTVMAMARSLLKGTHMPARFWGEAVRHAVYLLNRLPTKALGERTPFEAWMGRKPHLSHLRVFGCVAYVKNTTPHLKKLDDRSSPMVYLGVEEGCKAHRLFDPKRANNEENLPDFIMLDASYSDEPIVAADTEAGVEDVTPPSEAVVPMTSVSSPSTPSSNAYAATSSSESNTPESYEGPVRYRSLADIYANTEEIVGINEEVMMVMSEEPTCYQEAATEACCLEELGFKKCTQEHAVYTRRKGEVSILVGVYVDDLIVTGSSTENINKFKQQMMAEFDMSDLGLLSYYLGIEVEQQKNRILLRQSAYAKKILSHFKMADCNATKHPMEPKTQLHKDLEGTPIDATEYRRLIGCLRYLLHTRPDLSYSVGMASRYMERPTIMHHKVVKQILRYLKGTIHFGLVYIKGPQEFCIFGYSDSDLAGDLDGRKSTSGMAFYLNESLVSWNSQKQKTVALSSCEAEFMAATTAACHALWLKSLASELTGVEPKPVTLFVDNKSAIALMKNPVFHGRSKHIDTKFHFIRECVEKGQIEVEFVNTGEQRADVLTKALSGVKLAAMRQLLGVRDLQQCQD
ncbi:hypothetical protein ZIOFF_004221 [Zingiber officinale]|uniref:Integrase catalytic domain-containing protein n=1 Tax=Zingiber officinale TaxID=94328 RepID=A0A8J5IAY8_ZINOF|nr:hypothetical protein ZIOFF_004221 [Zingiber officinale]